MRKRAQILVGTAGWSIPRAEVERFPGEGSHLHRYAARLPAAEINSSFYRPHRESTYARWSASVPETFRFSVKIPKAITHERRLVESEALIDEFLRGARALGKKLGCLLVQLPPSLALDVDVVSSFFGALRERFEGDVVLEPRHPTWFTDEADALLRGVHVGRVAADPARVPIAAEPGGALDLIYFRLHGSPRIYYSSYDDAYLARLAASLRDAAASARVCWCIFDNTALGAAAANALDLVDALGTSKRDARHRDRIA